MSNKLNQVVDKLKENHSSLRINRVPLNTKREFVELADKEFCSDYGFCLKWLMDGIPKQDILELAQEIELIKEELLNIKNKPEEPEYIKMVDGTKRRKRK